MLYLAIEAFAGPFSGSPLNINRLSQQAWNWLAEYLPHLICIAWVSTHNCEQALRGCQAHVLSKAYHVSS